MKGDQIMHYYIKHFFRILFMSIIMFCYYSQAQWIQTNGPGGNVCDLCVSGNNIYCASGLAGVRLSADNGVMWSSLNSGLPSDYLNWFITNGIDFYCSNTQYVYYSTNNGTLWTNVSSGLNGGMLQGFALEDSNLFIIGTNGVFYSSDHGNHWAEKDSGISDKNVKMLEIIGNNIYAGTVSGSLYISINNGESWSSFSNGLNGYPIWSICSKDSNLFLATNGGGIYRSTNNSAWSQVNNGLTNSSVFTLLTSGNNLFAGTWGGGVFISTNNGTSWIAVNDGLTTLQIWRLAISGSNLFAGSNNYPNLFRRPLSELITNVGTNYYQIPSSITLLQNYPNPFNPSTTIAFSVPLKSFVLLKIFDALGREVSNLLSEELSAGIHSRQWNAEGLPSGIYFYRLQVGSFTDTKKLILLR
jgi:photosystem II stability/assembly factor-like uncharacterized protein